jgi:uncharacterized protein with HEPN domain
MNTRTSLPLIQNYHGAQMRGMRNCMEHGYFDINLDTLGETVPTSLSDLEEKLRKMPRSEEPDRFV